MANEYERQVEEERKRYLEEIRNREIAEMEYVEGQKQLALADTEREGTDTGQSYQMGVGSYVFILFAFFVDIIEFLTTYSGVGIPIAVVLGLLVDSAIFLAVGLSKNARKQWKRFALGALGENFPVIAQAIEWIPVRTIALIWMYMGMRNQGGKQPEKSENDKNKHEQ